MSDNGFYRWGIPGWVLVTTFMIFVAIDAVSAENARIFSFLEDVFGPQSLWQALLIGFLVAGSGVPIGFLLWQVYYYVRWNSPVSARGLWPPFIDGRSGDFEQGTKGIVFPKKKIAPLLEVDESNFKSVAKFVATLLHEAMNEVSKDSQSAAKRHTYLVATFHSLGSSLLGAAFGYGIYLLVKYSFDQMEFYWGLIALIYTAVILMLLSLGIKNPNGFQSIEKWLLGQMGDTAIAKWMRKHEIEVLRFKYPAELVLGATIFLFLNLFPGFNNYYELKQKLSYLPWVIWFLSIFLALLWALSTRDIGICFSVLGLTAFAFWFRDVYPQFLIGKWMNWPIILSIIVFQFFSIAFVTNRHNTVELLEAFENYYLYLYFKKLQ